ncbi:hypothetical protein OH76DRAFT_1367002, partial [Lentinus brumalis]
YVQQSIRRAMKDPVGRRDFALAADGARIAPKLTSSFDNTSDARPPTNILDEDMRSASCWAFPDDHAQVSIKLHEFIYVTHITIDHIPRDIATNIQEAPHRIVLWGIVDGKGNQDRRKAALESLHMSPLSRLGDGPPVKAQGTFLPLAAFDYDIDAQSHVQTFPVDPAVIASRIYFGAVVIEVKSNWGADFTKVYRVRIHGDVANT